VKPAILFDLDGTLIDSNQDIQNALLFSLEAHNFPIPDLDTFRISFGYPLHEIYSSYGVPASHQAELIATYRARYAQHCTEYTRVYAGVLDTLERLRAQGYALAVATSKLSSVAQMVCDSLELSSYVDHIQGTENFPFKPAPDVVYAAVSGLERHFAQTIQALWMVGDTTLDMQAGQAAKLQTYGLTWGTHNREQLEGVGATVVSDDFAELFRQLERSKPVTRL
jgi:phosphoglycolate phosphatase